ncbi:MAG TPA: hypothetical protein VJ553_07010 [Candidatus Paceibacterota bacterium]|nr:hypothetical protein [Candidatus Paceibacterota bacterium]
MRRMLTVALFAAFAVPAMADDPKCLGEEFVINGKYICAEDPGLRTNAPGTPLPVPDKPRPKLKLSGHLMANNMMTTAFDPAAYTYQRETKDTRQQFTSTATSSVQPVGWGVSAQWSPNEQVWIEFGWQRPPERQIGVGTTLQHASYFVNCGNALCRFRFGDEQTNHHRFIADDFALALKWDLEPKNRYVSVFMGGGVHRRYLRDVVDIETYRRTQTFDFRDVLAEDRFVTRGEVHRIDRSSQTRLFALLEGELYPAGKDRFVGFGVSIRLLTDGEREQQHFTDTLVDQGLMLGIEPGWYDVTARLILRF